MRIFLFIAWEVVLKEKVSIMYAFMIFRWIESIHKGSLEIEKAVGAFQILDFHSVLDHLGSYGRSCSHAHLYDLSGGSYSA